MGVVAGFAEAFPRALAIHEANRARGGILRDLGGFLLFALGIYAGAALLGGLAGWALGETLKRWRRWDEAPEIFAFAVPAGALGAFFAVTSALAGRFNLEPTETRSLAIAAAAVVVGVIAATVLAAAFGERGRGHLRHTLAAFAAVLLAGAAALRLATPAAPAAKGAAGGGARPPNLLLLVVDTLRADHLGAYGYPHPTSPRIDGLATEGVLFANAFAHSPATVPSHASLFTSRYPHSHLAFINGMRLDLKLKTLAERLRDAGYGTAAVVSNSLLNRRYGFDQGFSAYVELEGYAYKDTYPAAWRQELRLVRLASRLLHLDPATAIAEEMLRRLAAEGKPFFLWAHWMHPHAPYAPPRSLRRVREYDGPANGSRAQIVALQDGSLKFTQDDAAYQASLYDGEIRFSDRQVARLLAVVEELGIARQTLVALTSDHGENMYEHAPWYFDHGVTLYDSELAVPLILSWPGTLTPGRVDRLFGLVDFTPTVLELLGVPPAKESTVEGSSWAQRLRSGVAAPAGPPGTPPAPIVAADGDATVYAELVLDESIAVLARARDHALVEGKRGALASSEFYDLTRDSKQTYNLLDAEARAMTAEEQAMYKRLSGDLQKFRAGDVNLQALYEHGKGDFENTFDAETIATLKKLGYLK